MEKPIDTSKSLPGIAALFLSGTGFIEAQEAQGQREVVMSESLPAEIHEREQWEALGVVFGEPFPDDWVFCPAKLPEGWRRQATDHSMHTDIVDAQGRVRGSMFYKAAFYDRRAWLGSPRTRFLVRQEYPGERAADYFEGASLIEFAVKDHATGEGVFSVKRKVRAPVPTAEDRTTRGPTYCAWRDEHLALEIEARAEARTWLAERFPDHENPAAYWDLEDSL